MIRVSASASLSAEQHGEPGRNPATGFVLLPVLLLITLTAAAILLLAREQITNVSLLSGQAESDQARYVAEAGLRHALWKASSAGTCTGYSDLVDVPFGAHVYSATFSKSGGSPVSIAATGTLAAGISRTARNTHTKIFQAPLRPVHQPRADEAKDTTIDEFESWWNFGTSQELRIRGGRWSRRSLLRFDMSIIPDGVRLVSATLELNSVAAIPPGRIAIHRVTAAWSEGSAAGAEAGGATWEERHTGAVWEEEGGDFAPEAESTADVAGPAGSWIAWDVSALVQTWLREGKNNHGLILIPIDESVDARFHSSDGSFPDFHPRLRLVYACECGVGGESGVLSLRPGPGDGRDTRIGDAQATENFGALHTLSVQDAPGDTQRSLIRFDLSSIPPGTTVNSAKLGLQATAVSRAGTVSVHAMRRGWEEMQATWQQATIGESWASSGGDYDPTPADSRNVAGTGLQVFDVTSLADQWVQDPTDNHGLIMRDQSPVSLTFASSNSGSFSARPRLTLDITCLCGASCDALSAAATDHCDAGFEADYKSFGFDWAPGAVEVAGIDFLPEGTVVNGVTIPAGGGWIMSDRNQKRLFVGDMLGEPLTDFPLSLSDPRGVAFVESGAWAGHLAVADRADRLIYFLDLDGTVVASFTTTGITNEPLGLSFVGTTQISEFEGHLLISSHRDDSGNGLGGGVHIVDQSGTLVRSIGVHAFAPRPQGVAHIAGYDKILVSDRDGLVSVVDFAGTLLHQYSVSPWLFEETQGATVHPESCEHVIVDKILKKAGGFLRDNGTMGGRPRLLMVAKNANNPNARELGMIALFESWRFAVSLIDDGDNQATFDAAITDSDVVFLGESASASEIGNKLTGAGIGVVSEEAALSDELGLSTSIGWSVGSAVNVVDNGHYITAPFSPGKLETLTAAASLAHHSGVLAPGLRVLASSDSGPALTAMEFGGRLVGTATAQGRRVQLPWGDPGVDAGQLNDNGRALLRRALDWGVQQPTRCDADFAANVMTGEFAWMAGTGDIQGISYVPAGRVMNSVTVPAGGGWIMNDKNKDRLFVTDLAGNSLTDFPMLALDTQGVEYIHGGTWIHHLAVADKATRRINYLDFDGELISSVFTGAFTSNILGLGYIGATASGSYEHHLVLSSDKDPLGGGNATLYVLDQSGNLYHTIDVESFAPKPLGVTHVPGADKLIVSDETGRISVVDFAGNLHRQYLSTIFGLSKLTDIGLNPFTCDHALVDADSKRMAFLNHQGSGEGGGPQYAQMMRPFSASGPGAWETIDLGVFGVSADSVAEIALVNADGGNELRGGVRSPGSALERSLLLHEAGGGGTDAVVMHVQADAAGRIEVYSDDPTRLTFVLLGYWNDATYQEDWRVFKAGASASWQPHALGAYGVSPGSVAEILLLNKDGFFERQAGVRASGSALSRMLTLHEARDGGDEGVSMFIPAGGDAGATVEVYAEDDFSAEFVLAGHFTAAPGQYRTAFADLGTASASLVWEDLDLSPHGVPANAVVQLAAVNGEDGAKALLGTRSAGSGIARHLDLHESKNGGDDFASQHVRADAGAIIQVYDEDTARAHYFQLLGWWEPE